MENEFLHKEEDGEIPEDGFSKDVDELDLQEID